MGQVENHNHTPDEQFNSRSVFINELKDAVEQDATVPVRRVYDNIVLQRHRQGNSGTDSDNSLPDFPSLCSNLKRKRAEFFPTIPQTIRQVAIPDQWAETWAGRTFLCYQSNVWGILIFMSDRSARLLQTASEIYVDGTFKVCPRPYGQVLTIHATILNRVIPLAFCVLKSKETACYRKALKHLKLRVRAVSGGTLNPQTIVCDFEISLLNAAETEFPQAKIAGCFFHFCQAIWRHVQQLGLARAYRRLPQVKKFIRRLMAMGYLPLALVRINFFLMFQSNTVRRLFRRQPALRQLVDYFRRNYIDGNFRPRLWNVFERGMNTRTNNHSEGWAVFMLCLWCVFKKTVSLKFV